MDSGTASEQGEASDEKAKRERSKIEFPYSDLEATIEMARVLNANTGGAPCEDVQLAGWMNQTATGGTFRTRVSAGKLFGLIEGSAGKVALTPLGRDAIDSNKSRGAAVEAFLRVPLFSAMYDQYKGYALPPAAALERQMEALGVSSKVKDRARQTFVKSAQFAGFLDATTGRFIKPAVAAPPPPPDEDRKPNDEDEDAGGGGGGGGGGKKPPLHPFIQGLLDTLPLAETGKKSEWPVEERAMWLQTAASIFGLIYTSKPDPSGGSQTIKVSVDKGDQNKSSGS